LFRLRQISGETTKVEVAHLKPDEPAGLGRHLAAWISLTPKGHSTGGKQHMGGISRAGNERVRGLLVTGDTAVIRFANGRATSRPTNGCLRGPR
jgi:transposase